MGNDRALQTRLIQELVGTDCVCGARKPSQMTHCRKCYFALPEPARSALYSLVGHGYEEAYAESLRLLRECGRIPEEALRAE